MAASLLLFLQVGAPFLIQQWFHSDGFWYIKVFTTPLEIHKEGGEHGENGNHISGENTYRYLK